jgi:hypothetical protein
VPSSVETIGVRSFASCSKLESVTHQGKLKISDRAFFNCTSLKIFNAKVSSFAGGYEFYQCRSLESVVLADSVTKLYNNTLTGCLSLSHIISEASSAPTATVDPFGSGASSYVGRNTYNTGENFLYVPLNATGYDSGKWLDPLQNADKCGFSIPGKLTITSNRPDAQFEVVFLSEDGIERRGTVGVGDSYICEAAYGAEVTLMPISNYPGEVCTPKTFIYSEDTKVQDMQYETVTGIYIQHVNGSLFTTEAWTEIGMANDDANGVAVIVGVNSFVIAKESKSNLAFSTSSSTIYETRISDKSLALADMNGVGHTKSMYAMPSYYPAAKYCTEYTFPNGANGYLPASGELYLLSQYKNAVENALFACGGAKINPTNDANIKLTSSTAHSSNAAWGFQLGSSWEIETITRSSDPRYYIRPFTTLE